MKRFAVVLSAISLFSGAAHAGLYSDDLARCLVAKTSLADKTNLVRWIFGIATLHPDVSSLAAVSPEQRTALDRGTGQLIERLLTVDCREQTQAALKYEGEVAMQTSFQVLGQVAMQELMTHQDVASGLEKFVQYMDIGKLEQLQAKPAAKAESTRL